MLLLATFASPSMTLTSKLEFECDTRPRECTFSAPRDLRPSNPCLSRSETWDHRLRLPYRILLKLEKVTSVRVLHPANADCPKCKGKAEVLQHGGLRQKTCPRCNGKDWIRGDVGAVAAGCGRRPPHALIAWRRPLFPRRARCPQLALPGDPQPTCRRPR